MAEPDEKKFSSQNKAGVLGALDEDSLLRAFGIDPDDIVEPEEDEPEDIDVPQEEEDD